MDSVYRCSTASGSCSRWIDCSRTYKEINSLALIDSGADTATINIEYARFLGIDLSKSKIRNIAGIGQGVIPVYEGIFPFKIKEMDVDIKVPAWFVDSQNVNILLGQEVFFNKFKIKFEKDHDIFELVEVKK
jgi:hypothetical protein